MYTMRTALILRRIAFIFLNFMTSKLCEIMLLTKFHVMVCFHIFIAFGFCDYGDPEASLRAIRLLHNKALGDKALVVSRIVYHFAFS